MKKMMMLAICVSCLIVTGSMGVAPIAQYDPGFPGLRIDFVADVYPGQGEDGYGYMTTKSGWAHDGWAGNASASALGRMETTMQNAGNNKTSMLETEDWIFSATYNHTGAQSNEWPIFAKYDWDGSREDRMFAVTSSTGGTYGFLIGNASGGWDTVASGLNFSAWQDITIHYKVGLGLDYYLGDTLIATNQTTGHGRYDVDFMQIEYTKAGVDSWRAFKLVHVAPVCGDASHPYPEVGDLNQDCWVNFVDFAILTANWLESSAF